jgi:hypothetical protein
MVPARNSLTPFQIALLRFDHISVPIRALQELAIPAHRIRDWVNGKCHAPAYACEAIRQLLEQRAADDVRAASQLLPGPGRGSRGHDALGRWRAHRAAQKEKARQ